MNDLKGIIEDFNKSDLVSKKVIEKVIKIIGQKRWNRIHDEESDICTTMGELIITLKGIPDLEKEKCELLGIIQGKDKVLKELEEKISVLLSCKNCPENKGGYICEKEYENKCLSQKIQYIKELKDDNKVMADNFSKMEQKFYDNLSKTKELLRELYSIVKVECSPFAREEHKIILTEALEFLQEE